MPTVSDDCTDRTAGDNAGTGCGGLEQDNACAELTYNLVGNGCSLK